MNIASNLADAARSLDEAGVPDAARQAVSLMAFVLERPRSFLIAHPEYELTPTEQDAFSKALSRRAAREPLQYITGHREFWGLDFEMAPGVLIPRPETEILVEAAIEFLREQQDPTFCELGIGSGCVSVSLLHSVPDARAVAVDIWPEAIEIAGRNAYRHGVRERLEICRSDLFSDIERIFDMVVSNPPYIPSADIGELEMEVRGFESPLALDGGQDGLDVIRRLVGQSFDHLRPGGLLLIEIGHDQGDAVRKLFDRTVWNEPRFLNDLQGIPRVVSVARV